VSDVITIDGPAGSGKSTVSKLLAEKLHYLYLDTGAMYRAVALAAERNHIPLDQGARLGELCRRMALEFHSEGGVLRLLLDGEDISLAIRQPDMDMGSSSVSAVKEVREAMTELQRRMVKGINVVAEGRDMGTVAFPWARNKFFLTASLDERARRRYLERKDRGESVAAEGVKAALLKRDEQDETRALAPLKPAEDAILIDSTKLTQDQVVHTILAHLKEAL
jgi:cytidylate kinase